MILIFMQKHLKNTWKKLEEVFRRIKVAGLKIKPRKCQFAKPELTFLGHVVGKKGILPDPGKIEKVKNFPRPKTVTNIRSFLGLTSYYRKFIQNFSKNSK